MPKIIWEAAKKDERLEFQDLGMEKAKDMLVGEKAIDHGLALFM